MILKQGKDQGVALTAKAISGSKTDEIRNWYLQQHPNVLLRAKGTAENALQNYSSEVIDLALEDKHREIEESIIVDEIRELRKFGINLAGGFVASILFAALLTIAAFLVLSDASPAKIGKQLRNNVEEMTDGQEIRSHE